MRPTLYAALVGAFVIWSMGGLVFGIASLYPILYDMEVFATHSCTVQILQKHACPEQQQQFALVSSAGLFSADAAMILHGELADRAGAQLTFLTGCTFVTTGLALMACLRISSWLLYISFVFLGAGGPGIFVGFLLMQENNPGLSAVLPALSAASWDASSAVFLVFNCLYFAGLEFSTVVTGWIFVSLIAAFATVVKLPTWEESQSLRKTVDLHEQWRPLIPYVRRPDTLVVVAFMSAYTLKSSFLIMTYADQMENMFGEELGKKLVSVFNFAFPVGGGATAVVSAIVLDRLGSRPDLYMTIVLALAITVCLLNTMPFFLAQLGTALLFGPVRTIQWACYFHYLSHCYPPDILGRLIGYGNIIIATFGDLLPWVLHQYVNNYEIRPEQGTLILRYQRVHFFLLVLVSAFVPPLYFSLLKGYWKSPSLL